MAQGTFFIYRSGLKSIIKGEISLMDDTIKAILLDENHSFNADHVSLSDISANELDTGLGYTAGGQTITGINVFLSEGVTHVRANDPMWKAQQANLVADALAIYSETADNALIGTMIFSEQQSTPPNQNLLAEFPDEGMMTFTL